jgi:hypothetical protein
MRYMIGNLRSKVWITHVLEVGNFWVRKKSPKHINIESSFEDLVATRLDDINIFAIFCFSGN